MRLLSLDTSTKNSGWALFSNGKYTKSGVITCTNKDTLVRIGDMYNSIKDIIYKFKPSIVVIEMTSVPRNVQAQRYLTMLLGMVYTICLENYIEFVMLRPTEWRKMANTDNVKIGRKREEMKQWSMDLVENLFNKKVTDDESDAILIGYGYIQSFN